jgi:hypothetical protein
VDNLSDFADEMLSSIYGVAIFSNEIYGCE